MVPTDKLLSEEKMDLWFGTSGPVDAKIVLVGESWGAEELKEKRPFVGSSGTELTRILAEAGLDRNSILMTNVVAAKPLNNDMFNFFHHKDEVKVLKRQPVRGLYPTDFAVTEIDRLHQQIKSHPRSLVIAAGNWSMWAVSNCASIETVEGRKVPGGIMSWRGSMWYCDAVEPKTPMLPIIHPAAIQRAWYNRAVTVHDLKARVPMALRGDWRPNPAPVMLSPPTFQQAVQRLQMWLNTASENNKIDLAVDCETIRRRFISVVGFSDSLNFAMCIPFVRRDCPDGGIDPYWTVEEEATLVRLIRRVFLHPHIRVEGQNFIYDTQFFQEWFGVTPRLDFDTMLAQNVLFPGTPKGLDYLSSLFCRYHWYWKEDNKDWDSVGNLQRLMDYNCLDVLRTRECAATQRQLIKQLGQEWQWDFKMKVNNLCLRMMNRGVRIDTTKRAAMFHELQNAMNGYQRELLNIIPQEMITTKSDKMWYASPQQTAQLFYDILGFRKVLHPKTGRPTTGKMALEQLKKWHPEFTGLFNRLDMLGSVENTAAVVQMQLNERGRAQCSYNPAGTETHRLSSSKNAFGGGTNLQNLTKGEGR